ncbi:TetR/AcrR family transcriptional regulator [Roseburia sp. AM59-24XD]|jgi:AcrR family transcriptional regulator|uniref:TetR/AcrR family transcriptional regulator n=1 Tax=Roseburia sp. AM59-24XD TaxID=2293138 RepID=UPI001314A8A1|nr:TetR/AcrR family transcriptional regulator [Roseburia sp. AM59-24XD]MBS5666064.1 TetR/AcrR family transcriptional regulator [Roseburia sp.]
MAKRVFTEAERAEYREKMLAAGFDLLKQYGMTHMSVAKITEAAGIGVSTFYNFFPSKEAYVYDVMEYRKRMIPVFIKKALNGKEKAGPAETRNYLKIMIDEDYSIFPSLSPEDEKRLLEMLPEQVRPDLQKETRTSMMFFQQMEGIRSDVNIALVTNLIKIYVLGAEGRELLHDAAYEETMERMRDVIIYEIFGRTES